MAVKEHALQQLMEISHNNDSNIWSKVCPHCYLPTTLGDAEKCWMTR